MRSILAGLRKLVIPWGEKVNKRIVLGSDDPVAVAANADPSIVFYWGGGDPGGYILHSETQAPAWGKWSVSAANPGGILGTYMDAWWEFGLTQAFLDIAYGISYASVGAEQVELGIPGTTTLLNAMGKALGNSIENRNVNSGTTTSTNVGSFADFGDGALVFSKAQDDTQILVTLSATFYVTDANTGVEFGVRTDIGGPGTFYPICGLNPTIPALNHLAVSGTLLIPAGSYPQNAYNFTPVWRRSAGAGTVRRDFNDRLSFTVQEVASA